MRRECRERFPHHRLQKKPLVSDPGMHQGTCVTHVPWCMSGLLTRSGRENIPGIPGACAIRKYTYLAWGPLVTWMPVCWFSREWRTKVPFDTCYYSTEETDEYGRFHILILHLLQYDNHVTNHGMISLSMWYHFTSNHTLQQAMHRCWNAKPLIMHYGVMWRH